MSLAAAAQARAASTNPRRRPSRVRAVSSRSGLRALGPGGRRRDGGAEAAERFLWSCLPSACRGGAHVQAGDGTRVTGSGLDKITDLVDQPEALTAQFLVGREPVPG